jgi:glutathione synthase/RimK-type ligase-like ATP-grasp enzyme
MLLTVVGNPENRRMTLLRAAARGLGLPAPRVLAWRDVLAGARPEPGALLRVDSPGEDPEVDRLLRGAPEPARHGELIGLAAAYAGLVRAAREVAAGAGTVLNPPEDIAVLCDKRRCHALLSAAGVPVPPALSTVSSEDRSVRGPLSRTGGILDGYASLRAGMAAAGWGRVFVKPAYGSSAAGVIALQTDGVRVNAVTPVEVDGGRLYNSLRVRRYTREADVAAIVDRLAPDGLHVERWFPKAGLDTGVLDLRVVVIAGRPTHAVVRTGPGPITNLHLGNARGDLAAVRTAAGPAGWAAAMETCERVAALFPRSLHVGVDLMFSVDWRTHAVAEVNAFGDLLPGLLAHGRDTYAEELHALATGRYDAFGREGAACAI